MRTYTLYKPNKEYLNLTDDEVKNLDKATVRKILIDNENVLWWEVKFDGDTCYYYIPEWKEDEDLLFLLKNKMPANKFMQVDKETIDNI